MDDAGPSATTSDRGFDRYPPVPGVVGMDLVRSGSVEVYESSMATEPCLWLRAVQGPHHSADRVETEAVVHLRVEDARVLRDQLSALVDNHYQLAER